MRKANNNTGTKNSKKKFFIIGLVIVLISAAVAVYFFQNRPTEKPVSVVADPDFEGGTDREPGSSVERNGGVTSDENPDTDTQEQNDPLVSSSGAISVYEPQPNQLLKSGDKLYGTATVDEVWYRLIDDQIGMITQGSLPVKDGRFAGTFNFSTDGTNGRLDIFRMTEEGLEADNIEVDVKFK